MNKTAGLSLCWLLYLLPAEAELLVVVFQPFNLGLARVQKCLI